MLIFKRALQECGIPQKVFVAASGRSKSQVSLALSKNVLPANMDSFAADVKAFAANNANLMEWLNRQGFRAVDLLAQDPLDADFDGFRKRSQPGFPDKARSVVAEMNQSEKYYNETVVEKQLWRMVGEVVLFPGYEQMSGVADLVVRLAKCCIHLRMELEEVVDTDNFRAADIMALVILEGR